MTREEKKQAIDEIHLHMQAVRPVADRLGVSLVVVLLSNADGSVVGFGSPIEGLSAEDLAEKIDAFGNAQIFKHRSEVQ